MKKFRETVYHIHDIECNQKYAGKLPYSFHLECVEAQGEKFIHLVREGNIINDKNNFATMTSYKDIVRHALIAHDLIEDGRCTYNNIVQILNRTSTINFKATNAITDIVYAVSDEKGKNRAERKNEKYYKELSENDLAVFVKLADIAANTLFSKLTGSSMYDKYKSEFSHFKEMCYKEQYKEFFQYVETL